MRRTNYPIRLTMIASNQAIILLYSIDEIRGKRSVLFMTDLSNPFCHSTPYDKILLSFLLLFFLFLPFLLLFFSFFRPFFFENRMFLGRLGLDLQCFHSSHLLLIK